MQEDEPSSYHVPLVSYVTAQGLYSGHAVAIAAFDRPASEFVARLPLRVEGAPSDERPAPPRDVQRMDIAWRYQNSMRPGSHVIAAGIPGFACEFDLSQTAVLPKTAAVSCVGRGVSGSIEEVLAQLESHLKMAAQRKLLSRIVVHGLSAAFLDRWTDAAVEVSRFLSRVRAFTRVFGAVAVVSCAKDIPHRTASMSCDALLQIDSFGGRGAGVAGLGKEWLGVLIVHKTFRDRRGLSLRGRGDVWVFKRGRRKYVMERATAAPDDEEISAGHDKNGSGASHEHADIGTHPGVLCNTKPSSSGFDF